MVRRALLALALLLLPLPPALAQVSDDDVEVSLTISHPGDEVFVQEAVFLTLSAVLHRPVFSFDAAVPPIPDARLVMLARDRWTANVDNLGAKRFERRIALYPQRSGPLEIPSFEVHATLVDGNNALTPVVARTKPQIVAVGAGPDEAALRWWLPARSVTVTDTWERPPNELKVGEAARRTVVIEAVGVLPQQLPPLPPLRTTGIVTFANPVQLETLIGEEGPIARATYAWDIRLGVPEPVLLQALTIPWFDTTARRMREASLPARRIGAAVATEAAGGPAEAGSAAWLSGPMLASGLAAFLAGLAWLVAGRSGNAVSLRTLFDEHRRTAGLRRAVRAGDPAGLRAALTALLHRADGSAAADPEVRAAVAGLDRHLFAAPAGPAPSLAGIARVVRRARRRAGFGNPPPG